MIRALVAVLIALIALPTAAPAETKLRVGWCAKTVSSATAPFAIATKLGWYKAAGLDVELIPLAGSSACTQAVATREVPFALPSVEPLAIAVHQGVKAKVYYTAYQGNIYGIAVPAESPVRKIADLKGKTIGVISMGSAGVPVAKALVATAGLNPESDVTIVVAGEGAQTAAMLRSKHVDALSQFDTQYAMVENAGVRLRMLDTKEIDRYPANGFLALDETLKNRRQDAVALAKGYAMGTVFAIANPEAAVRILYEVFPQTKPTGKDEAMAIRDDRLTGLFTLAYLEELLKRDWAVAHREQRSIAVFAVDIDALDLYNNTFGRGAGDSSIRRVAHVVSGCLRRSSDVTARIAITKAERLFSCPANSLRIQVVQ